MVAAAGRAAVADAGETPFRPPRSRRGRWVGLVAAAGALVLLFVLGLGALAAVIPLSSETLQRQVIDALSTHLEGEVDLQGLQLRVLPRPHIDGFGLQIHHKGRRDVPPLIKVEKLTVEASFDHILRRHVNRVTLIGLESTSARGAPRAKMTIVRLSPTASQVRPPSPLTK